MQERNFKSYKIKKYKLSINIKIKIKEVFYLKKVRPRDLTENFGTGSAYLIDNQNRIAEMY